MKKNYWPAFTNSQVDHIEVLVLCCTKTVSCTQVIQKGSLRESKLSEFAQQQHTSQVRRNGKGANEFGTLQAHMHKMVSITLELFSACFGRQMRLSVHREPNDEVCLIDVSGLDACEVHLLLPSPGHVLDACVLVSPCPHESAHAGVCVSECGKRPSPCSSKSCTCAQA